MNHHAELFVRVNHHAFTLLDERACWNGVWTNRSFQRDGVGVAPGVVSVVDATRGSGEAPVLVEVLDREPGDDDLADYDGVVDAPLEAPSGRLRIVSGSELFPVASLAPGSYRTRVYYGNADAADPGGDSGADHYRVAIWRAEGGRSREIDLRMPKPRFEGWETSYLGSRTRQELARWLDPSDGGAASVSHRCLGAVALLRLGDLGTVRRALQREPSRAVQAVVASAAWIAGDDATELLAGMTLSSTREVRRRAVQSLARLSGPTSWRIVSNLANDPDGAVRDAVIAAQSERGMNLSPRA
jgi:hypothetical protein